MTAADDAYDRLQAAQHRAALMTQPERDELDKAQAKQAERARIKRRLWKPF